MTDPSFPPSLLFFSSLRQNICERKYDGSNYLIEAIEKYHARNNLATTQEKACCVSQVFFSFSCLCRLMIFYQLSVLSLLLQRKNQRKETAINDSNDGGGYLLGCIATVLPG